tara:strand:- start:39 stop:251 length:213 start_codon:yes stop_codon:yes gene_type:complete
MNLITKAQRSDLSLHFRGQAAKALREYNKIDITWPRTEEHLRGIHWGIFIAYKNASDMLDLDIISTKQHK